MNHPQAIHDYYALRLQCIKPVNDFLIKYGVSPARSVQELSDKFRYVFEKNKNDESFLKDFVSLHPDKDMLIWYANEVELAEKKIAIAEEKRGLDEYKARLDKEKYQNCAGCAALVMAAEGTKAASKVSQPEKMATTLIIAGVIIIGSVFLSKALK